MTTVFDIETDGLLDELTKIHVMSWSNDMGEVKHTHDYDEMRYVLLNSETLVGHNIIRFDIPAVERVLGIKVTARLVDTLALSWYLHHDRMKHGLEGYGEEYGVPKPVIKDWNTLTPEEYAHRCDEDVKINNRLWRDLDLKLNSLYKDAEEDKERLVDYLTFKLDCAREQEDLRWKLDVDKAREAYDKILSLKSEKVEQLAEAMPKKILTRMVTQPKVMRKKDGSLSANGEKWEALCKEHRQPTSAIKFVVKTGEERGNPNSNDQVKDWLYSLGWKPVTYKFTRNKVTGEEKMIAQVRKGSELCQSVRDLSSNDAAVDLLDGLTVLTHRAGILKSFLECATYTETECDVCNGSGGNYELYYGEDEELLESCLWCGGSGTTKDGWLQAGVAGLTNTFRFKHFKPLVNLPSVDKPYGDVIRGCLVAPEGYVLAGADMTSLEDTTKRHYMKPLDPDYVNEMSREGFDPHLDLALHAGVITQDDIDRHNSGERSLKSLRKNYKVVNYSATYGVGASKLARETGMTNKEAKVLLEAFWSRNHAIEKVAKSLRTRELFGGMWLKNPVSGFWYSLRSEKDRFSTLNQSTGVFCFDTWVSLCRSKGIKCIGQFHDEVIALVKRGKEGHVEEIMHEAAIKLNEKVKLNVPLGTDVQFGNTYADIH